MASTVYETESCVAVAVVHTLGPQLHRLFRVGFEPGTTIQRPDESATLLLSDVLLNDFLRNKDFQTLKFVSYSIILRHYTVFKAIFVIS